MAKDEKPDRKSADAGSKKSSGGSKGHPFLWGLLFGVIAGCVLGWWYRSPDRMTNEQLAAVTKQRLEKGADASRNAMASMLKSLGSKIEP